MKISSTDTTSLDFYEDIVVSQLWKRDLDDRVGLWLVVEEGLHGLW